MKYHIDFDIDFKRNTSKGLYIALEGIDGAGKTVQAEKLSEYFRKIGKNVVKTREPRKEGLIGDLVHQILRGEVKVPAKALQYLFTTDRVIHHEEIIMPSLKTGKVVISDRSFWSAVVYGILDKERDYDYQEVNQILVAQSILSMYHQFTVPDFTFYLNIGLEESMRRIEKKHEKDPKEIYEEREKVEKVRKGYGWLMENFKEEITLVDGEKSVDDVTKELIEFVNQSGRI